ncbi:hypothetical protein [uncultured Winogradskyella sp.]|uniref:hypothetical protein n=1 Tax=uncultured Winogradskyella sp. TaxID=395353 RepID=UPI0030D894F5|tara:strand:- start:170 stop:637 length:468 start_codon:yes stop_codon:yes gene_type:complete
MFLKFFLSLFIISNAVTAKHTKRFANLVQNLKHNESSYNKSYYANGNVKTEGAWLYYDRPEYNYSKKNVLWLEYYKTGTIKIKSQYDKFGNLLQKSIYTLQGHISSHLIAVLIDSELTNYKTYFIRNEEVLITFSVNNYMFGLDIGKVYLREKAY